MKTKRKISSKNITRRIYVSLLKKLYPSCKHDSVDHSLYQNHKITYGEMEYEGIEQLYHVVKWINPKVNCFIDIGSGRGKLCMYMASQPKIKNVIGVEIVKERHDEAQGLKSKLKNEISDKVTLFNKNILDIDFKKYTHYESFIWFSNLCFESNTKNEIFKKLSEEFPKGTIICCSKEPDISLGNFIKKIEIPMSWNSTSEVNIYKL